MIRILTLNIIKKHLKFFVNKINLIKLSLYSNIFFTARILVGDKILLLFETGEKFNITSHNS